jgi:ribosomal protein S18 acetylase RimI-like enzyme
MERSGVRVLENLAFRTWLPEEIGLIGGWAAGATGGFTRRANSAQTIGEPGLRPEVAHVELEAWYLRRGLAPCAKITPASPDWIDPLLKENGWKLKTPSSVMTLDLTGHEAPSGTRPVTVYTMPPLRWMQLSTEWEGHPPSSLPHHQSLLSRIPSAGFLTLRERDQPVALGVCALDGPDAFLYDLVVDPHRRGHGLGKALLHALLNWARSKAARRALLQVVNTNMVARRLYDTSGFLEAYRYHYRELPLEE